MDQSGAVSTGIFSQWTNQAQHCGGAAAARTAYELAELLHGRGEGEAAAEYFSAAVAAIDDEAGGGDSVPLEGEAGEVLFASLKGLAGLAEAQVGERRISLQPFGGAGKGLF
eukprot:1191638-Prorocentrum_minimum.AAC.2